VTVRHARKEEKRLRILQAARDLFGEHGFDQTTTRAIARAAGVANGTLFLYARDKVDLLLMLYIDALRELTRTGLPDDDVRPLHQAVLDVYTGFFTFYERDPALGRVFVREVLFAQGERGADYAAVNEEFATRLSLCVGRAQDRGELRPDVAPVEVVAMSFAHYVMVIYFWIQQSEPQAADARAMLDRTLRLMWEGLGPRG
jgi:AcrR family transcriptional regulator